MKNYLALPILLCLISMSYLDAQTADSISVKRSTLPPEMSSKEQVDSLRKMVRAEYYKKNYDRTITLGEEALEIANKIKDYKAVYGISSFMGNAFLRIDDTLQAKRLFGRTLKAAEERQDSSYILTARIDLANMYALQERFKPALVLYKEAIPLAEQLADSLRLYILNYNIAESQLELDDIEEADRYIRETGKYVKGSRNMYVAGYELLLGRLNYYKGAYDSAISNLEKSAELSEETSFQDGMIESYVYLSKSHAMKGNYSLAYRLQLKVDSLKSERYQQDKITAVETATAKFKLKELQQDLRETELQNEANEQRAKRETTVLWVQIASAILLVFSIFLFASYLKRKKLFKDLQIKNVQYLEEKEKTEELSKAKAKLFSNISHELRTPMFGIIGISSMLMEADGLSEHKKSIESLRFSAEYLLSLINNVLQLNSLDSSKTPELNSNKFELRELVDNVIKSASYMKQENLNKFDVHIDDAIPRLLIGDDIRLSQVLMNLVGNAYKFTQNGTIFVHIMLVSKSQNQTKLQFLIRDTGPGIPEETKEHLFDEFAETSHTGAFVGTGLGLPIVKKILDLHGSDIQFHSNGSTGTAFKFEIDYEIGHIEEEIQEELEIVEDESLKDKRILVVDDNRINLLVTQKSLEKQGVVAVTASCGKDGVELAKEGAFDLILMDINMPDINGFDASNQIREFNTQTPIIALTAVEADEIDKEFSRAIINDYIIKPYNNAVFFGTLKKYIV